MMAFASLAHRVGTGSEPLGARPVVLAACGGLKQREAVVQRETEDGPDFGELLKAVGSHRDIDAYELLFRHFAPRVKSYMARLDGSGQRADELMQQTMIAVWDKADRFDPARGAASTWIFTIARNIRIDAFRRERHPEFDSDDLAFIADETMPADVKWEAEDDAQRLRAAIADLPADQSTLITLSYFEDCSHSAIAAKLGIPLGTVKSRLRLAFAKLRAALGQSGEGS